MFPLLTLFEELLGDLGEGHIGQHILVAAGQVSDFLLGLFKAGLQGVGKAALQGLLIAQNLLDQFGVQFAGSSAVFAADVGLDFLGDVLIPLAGEHIVGRLHTHHLAGGG